MGIFDKSYWVGNKESWPVTQRYTPQGRDLLSQLMKQGKQNTNFDAIQNMYMKNLTENMIPSIATRFGSQNQDSSAYRGALGNVAANATSQLAALRSQYGLQQSQLGLTPQFDVGHKEADSGFLGSVPPAIMDAALSYLTSGTYKGKTPPPKASPLESIFDSQNKNQPFNGVRGQSPYPDDQGGPIGQRTYTGDGYLGGNTMEDMKQVSQPSERYAHLFDRNGTMGNWQQPGNSYGNNPLLKQLMSLLQNPGVNRNYPNY